MGIMFYGFIVFLFAAVILAVEGVYLWWISSHGEAAKRIARRLQVMAGTARRKERISILKQRRFSKRDGIDGVLQRWSLARRVDQLLQQAGSKRSVDQFLLASLGAGLLALLLLSRWPLPLGINLLLAVLCGGIPYMFARRARIQRLIQIEQQLPEAADFIARALRAGHTFTNVLQIAGDELAEPLSAEFRVAREEINYGVPMSDALHGLADRIPLTDLRFLVIAVLIQRESGGNLAEILDNISQIIRGRLKLQGQVRVLSAEGRMSAWILGLLPFAVIVVMMAANPKYISTLWMDPIGIKLLWVAAGMLVVGVLSLRQLIKIRV